MWAAILRLPTSSGGSSPDRDSCSPGLLVAIVRTSESVLSTCSEREMKSTCSEGVSVAKVWENIGHLRPSPWKGGAIWRAGTVELGQLRLLLASTRKLTHRTSR